MLCTGNVGSATTMERIRRMAKEAHVVRGEADDKAHLGDLPDSIVVQIGTFRIGVISGYQIVPQHGPG